MGLLDEVMGAVMRGQQQQPRPHEGGAADGGGGGLGDLLGGMLGGANDDGRSRMEGTGGTGGGLGDLLGGMLGGGSGGHAGGGLADVLGSVLGNDGRVGGIGGILDRFRQAGLGDKADSWVGNGPNAPVSGEQVDQALGSDTLRDLAARIGLNPSMLSGLLASVLPMLIDRFTPHGQVPEQGIGDQQEVQRRLTDSL